jgi:hypothetical protein
MNCKFCDTPIESKEKGRKRHYCNDVCKVKWHYHNNDVFRENMILQKLEKYYKDPSGFMEKNKTYKKRENYPGNKKSPKMEKDGITWRKHLFDEEEPNKNITQKDPESFMDNLGFGNVNFDFLFNPEDKSKKEGDK